MALKLVINQDGERLWRSEDILEVEKRMDAIIARDREYFQKKAAEILADVFSRPYVRTLRRLQEEADAALRKEKL